MRDETLEAGGSDLRLLALCLIEQSLDFRQRLVELDSQYSAEPVGRPIGSDANDATTHAPLLRLAMKLQSKRDAFAGVETTSGAEQHAAHARIARDAQPLLFPLCVDLDWERRAVTRMATALGHEREIAVSARRCKRRAASPLHIRVSAAAGLRPDGSTLEPNRPASPSAARQDRPAGKRRSSLVERVSRTHNLEDCPGGGFWKIANESLEQL